MHVLKTLALSLLLACAAPLAFADDPPESPGESAPPPDVESTEPIQRLEPAEVTSSPISPVSTPQASGEESRTARPGAGVSVSDVSVPVSSYSGKRLERRVRGTLGEVLGHEPGVTMTAFGAGASRPIIRGLGGERVRVLEGGFGSSDVSSLSEDHATTVSPHLIRSVEVLRGPAVLRYGPLAIGGVTNVEDGRIPESPIRSPFRGMVEAWYGTADDEVGGVFRVEGQRGRWNWHVSAGARSTDDTDIPGFARSAEERAEEPVDDPDEEPNGTVPNSNTWTRGATAGASQIGPWGFFGVSLQWFRTEYGVPGEEHHEEEDDPKPTNGSTRAVNFDGVDSEGVDINMERFRVEAKGRSCRVPSCFTQFDYGLAYTTYEHTEFEEGDTGTVFDSDTIEGRFEASHRSIAGWRGAIGLQAEYNELEAIGDEAFIPPSDTFRLGTYVFETRRLAPCWHAELAARVDYVSIDSTAGDEDFFGVSASGGVRYDLSRETSATASLSYTERAPTATELFANGPHVATGQFEIGDATLDKERSVGVDLGVRHQGRRTAVAVNGYYTRFLDFIELAPTGGVMDGLPVFAFRQEEAEFVGLEVEASVRLWTQCRCGRPHGAVDWNVFGDWVRGTNLDDDVPLARIPPWRVGTSLTYISDLWDAEARVQYVAEQDRTAPNESATGDYVMLDVGVSRRLGRPNARRGVTIYVRGTNLLDEEARVHSSRLKDLVPLRGRSFLLGSRFDF